jgi:hypothetical protein
MSCEYSIHNFEFKQLDNLLSDVYYVHVSNKEQVITVLFL